LQVIDQVHDADNSAVCGLAKQYLTPVGPKAAQVLVMQEFRRVGQLAAKLDVEHERAEQLKKVLQWVPTIAPLTQNISQGT
jgi:hypothetical protein